MPHTLMRTVTNSTMASPLSIVRSLLRSIVPGPIRALANRWAGLATTFNGPYPDWASAAAASIGYDSEEILDKVISANRAVLRGDAAFERDSVLFAVPSEPTNLIDALRACNPRPGGLRILDFGGALGSLYHQARPFLGGIEVAKWIICEQPHYVAAGKQEFSHPPASFVASLEETLGSRPLDLIIVSGVIHYLPRPIEALARLATLDAQVIFLDRTPATTDPSERACVVQHVPRSIYRASYPAWLLPRDEYLRALAGYDMASSWKALDPPIIVGGIRAVPMGATFVRRPERRDIEGEGHV